MIMATATFDNAYLGNADTASKTKKSGLFARFVAARQAQANRRVAQCLATYSDRQLADIGFTRSEVDLLNQGKSINIG